MKKILSVLLTVILVCSIGVIGAQAASYDPDRTAWCFIKNNMTYEETIVVYGRDKFFGGQNYPASTHKLVCGIMYYSTDYKSFVYDRKETIDLNDELYSTHCNTTFTEEVSWKTRITPAWPHVDGCNGSGFIWYTN